MGRSHHRADDTRFPAGQCRVIVAPAGVLLMACLIAFLTTTADGSGKGAVADGLKTPLTAAWHGVPLHELAGRIADMADIIVVIDRRIDPTVRLSIESDGDSTGDVLQRLATEAGCGMAVVGHGVRLVPAEHVATVEAGDLTATRAHVTASASLRRRLARTQRLGWDAGESPQDILGRIAGAAGLNLVSLELVPHDHLPEASYEAMPIAEALALVLGHYDLTFTVSGEDAIHITPSPTGASTPHAVAKTPPAKTAARGPRGRRTSPMEGQPIDSFSLEAAAPLEKLLSTLASNFGLTLAIDVASLRSKAVDPGEIVRLKVVETPRDGVLHAVLGPLGLEWSIEGDTLRVR